MIDLLHIYIYFIQSYKESNKSYTIIHPEKHLKHLSIKIKIFLKGFKKFC